jgi:hypothetical protein
VFSAFFAVNLFCSSCRFGGLLFGFGFLELIQLLLPLGGFFGATRGVVELYEALKRFLEAARPDSQVVFSFIRRFCRL